ncbi:MAG: dTMP kinase [Pseudomonadota bacterium]|jgi:dTMP kinase|uniref:Thymidylate kinase n=1 Tax=Methylophaga thalassica TaxID=40223 RepID=A0ABQ5TSL9_9GAMM|nr:MULTISPECIES: dTMP kinase [Methylophaga]MEC9411196.1 dTMP kinase [Pseudomonadota bacterium]GLP99176.1 thymidylate kinase [Methylophaga thalassica]HIC45575.1 dTMP kinase [Methylophaga sp.]HIM39521.1 dTMP kinase [Methylophaga aminisulfidivorans]
MTGKFISVEGIEGAGKSTQIQFIKSYLENFNKSVIVTREPGGTPLGEEIRELLLRPRKDGMSDDTELLLMFAARAEHIKQVILPALAAGKWVVCDRFVDATFAYQGGGRGIHEQRISSLSDWTLDGLKTDLTLLFDLPVQIGQQRVNQRLLEKDRFEQEKTDFFEKIRQCYLDRAVNEPERIQIIDASQSIDNIQQQVSISLNKLLQSV